MSLSTNLLAVRAVSYQVATDLVIGIMCGFIGMVLMLAILVAIVRYSPGGRERIHDWIPIFRRAYIRGARGRGGISDGNVDGVVGTGNASRPTAVGQGDAPRINDIEMNNRIEGWRDIPLEA
jgi:hypothetical protein